MINIIWPAMLAWFLDASDNREGALWKITLALIAGVCCSTVGVYLLPISFGCLTLVQTIKNRDIKFLRKCCIAAIPSLCLLLLDLFVLFRTGGLDDITGLVFTHSWFDVIVLYFRENPLYPVLFLLSFFL